MKQNWNFLDWKEGGGGGGGQNKKKNFCGVSVDIFWNCISMFKCLFLEPTFHFARLGRAPTLFKQ